MQQESKKVCNYCCCFFYIYLKHVWIIDQCSGLKSTYFLRNIFQLMRLGVLGVCSRSTSCSHYFMCAITQYNAILPSNRSKLFLFSMMLNQIGKLDFIQYLILFPHGNYVNPAYVKLDCRFLKQYFSFFLKTYFLKYK